MSKRQVVAAIIGAAALGLSPEYAHAGPCSQDIAQFEAAVRQSANNPFAGLTAPQSIGADLNHQPTVASMKRAEARMKSKFSSNLARAKALDKRGDRAGCARSLDAAKRMYIL